MYQAFASTKRREFFNEFDNIQIMGLTRKRRAYLRNEEQCFVKFVCSKFVWKNETNSNFDGNRGDHTLFLLSLKECIWRNTRHQG